MTDKNANKSTAVVDRNPANGSNTRVTEKVTAVDKKDTKIPEKDGKGVGITSTVAATDAHPDQHKNAEANVSNKIEQPSEDGRKRRWSIVPFSTLVRLREESKLSAEEFARKIGVRGVAVLDSYGPDKPAIRYVQENLKAMDEALAAGLPLPEPRTRQANKDSDPEKKAMATVADTDAMNGARVADALAVLGKVPVDRLNDPDVRRGIDALLGVMRS